jgi:hypothetical protein
MGQRYLFRINYFLSRLQTYLSNKELGFGRQVYESDDYVVYNTIVEEVIRELVNDKI